MASSDKTPDPTPDPNPNSWANLDPDTWPRCYRCGEFLVGPRCDVCNPSPIRFVSLPLGDPPDPHDRDYLRENEWDDAVRACEDSSE